MDKIMFSGIQWSDLELAINNAFLLAWQSILIYIPLVLVALIVFVVGLLVARGLQEVVEKVVSFSKLDMALSKTEVKNFFDRAGFRLDTGYILGVFTKWFIILVSLMVASDILQLNAVTQAISSLLAYLPNVLVAAVILIFSVLFANFFQKVVKGVIVASHLRGGNLVSAVVKWAVLIIGFLMAFEQLKIETTVLSGTLGTVLVGFVFMFAIAGGLAFGLAGRDYAHELLGRLKEELEERM